MWMYVYVTFIVVFFTVPAALYWIWTIDGWIQKNQKKRKHRDWEVTITNGVRRTDGDH